MCLLILSVSDDGSIGHTSENLQQGLASTLDRRFTLSHTPLVKERDSC